MSKLQNEKVKDETITSDDINKVESPSIDDQNNVIHPLQNSWTLWCDITKKKYSSDTYGESLKTVYTVKSVEEFWSLVNSVKGPTEFKMDLKVNLHLFKNDIPPKWEDENNKGGGMFIIENVSIDDADSLWKYTMLACISESLEDPTSDYICGCSINIRARKYFKLFVWTKAAHDTDAIERIRGRLIEFLSLDPKYKLSYKPHNN